MTREDLINQRATTCRHGGHCEWVACDKCNHYEPDVLNQQPCEDCISRKEAILQVQRYGVGCFDAEEFSPEQCERFVIQKLNELKPVTLKEKTGHWIFDDKCREHGHCSECGYGSIDLVNGEPHDFCRRCGAKMIEPPQESEVQK